MVGKVPMKNWKAGIANWDRMQQTRNGGNGHAKQLPETFAERDSASVVEAARRIGARARGAGNDVTQDRKTLFGSEDAAIIRRPRQLPRGSD